MLLVVRVIVGVADAVFAPQPGGEGLHLTAHQPGQLQAGPVVGAARQLGVAFKAETVAGAVGIAVDGEQQVGPMAVGGGRPLGRGAALAGVGEQRGEVGVGVQQVIQGLGGGQIHIALVYQPHGPQIAAAMARVHGDGPGRAASAEQGTPNEIPQNHGGSQHQAAEGQARLPDRAVMQGGVVLAHEKLLGC